MDLLPDVLLLTPAAADPADGIAQYTGALCAELIDGCRLDARVVDPRAQRHADLFRSGVCVLQYQPDLYGPRGFAPWLAGFLRQIRRIATSRVVTMVHEPFLPMGPAKTMPIAIYQRAQLRLVLAASDQVFVSIQPWADMLRRWRPARSTVHLPVGSNLPDRRADREATRAQLGVTEGDVVVAAFGRAHPARMLTLVTATANEVAGHARTTVLNLGAGSPPLRGLNTSIRYVEPGFLESGRLAALLAAADVCLLPFSDGASTRRTALMAALRNGVPVVSTAGHLTDQILLASDAVETVPVADAAAFARAGSQLALKPELAASRGQAGLRLYAEQFDWPVLARRLMTAVHAG